MAGFGNNWTTSINQIDRRQQQQQDNIELAYPSWTNKSRTYPPGILRAKEATAIVRSTMAASASTSADPTILASKRALYVGGLADEVTPSMVRAAFIPFGNIKTIDMPMDYKVGKHRHFAFVEFDDAEDASEAIFNMDGSDLVGKTIRVSLAQQNQLHKLSSGSQGPGGAATAPNSRHQAIWNSDDWFQQHVVGNSEDEQKRKDAKQDVETLVD